MFEGTEVLSRNCDVLSLLVWEPNILTTAFTVFVNLSTKCRDYSQNTTGMTHLKIRSPPFPSLSTCNLLVILFVIIVFGVTESVVKHTIQLKDPHYTTCLQISDHYILWL